MRVVVVEDEPLMAQAIQRGLTREAMAVDVAHTGDAALELLSRVTVDVVILDRDLPGMSGDEVCRRLVAQPVRPRILMLTAARRPDDAVRGLELGADDYLAKPFHFPELVARVRALGRRIERALPPRWVRHGVTIDIARAEVYRDGRYIRLSPKEFAVLQQLMIADGAVVSAEQLLERAWDENADPFTHTIRVTISTLRRRLGEPPVIRTVAGFGYAFRAPEEP